MTRGQGFAGETEVAALKTGGYRLAVQSRELSPAEPDRWANGEGGEIGSVRGS